MGSLRTSTVRFNALVCNLIWRVGIPTFGIRQWDGNLYAPPVGHTQPRVIGDGAGIGVAAQSNRATVGVVLPFHMTMN